MTQYEMNLAAIEAEHARRMQQNRKVTLIACVLATIFVVIPLGILYWQHAAEAGVCKDRIECQM